MASLNYDSFADDVSKGNIVPSSDTFYAMLVTSTYTPNKGTHLKRSDVTNEVTGTGYTAGGSPVACTVAKDTSGHKETYTFANPSWAAATITARAAVIYKHRAADWPRPMSSWAMSTSGLTSPRRAEPSRSPSRLP